jgi:endonuclease/exonuclease/phosphatase family metal-dependent hydrolase
MSLLVRTWNLFHGNVFPPERRHRLREMLALATADRPDVLCLQELPAWAIARLEDWTGMRAVAEVAALPQVGPILSTANVGRGLTRHHGLLRSAFTGQANAILVAPALRMLDRERIVLNPSRFRRAQTRWLGLDLVTRLAWAKERRVCHSVRVRLPRDGTMVIANLHASNVRGDERVIDAELRRAATFADGLARPGEPVLLCGDFNLVPSRSRTLTDLRGWGFSEPGPGIDQVLVRGLQVGAQEAWPDERRRLGGRLLSDHAPVEVRIG